MISPEQLKAVELLATGHTIPQTARIVGIHENTLRGWLKDNVEVVSELSRATDTFSKECLKSRSRAYRQMAKTINGKIIEKMQNGDLDSYSIDDLIKMLNKVVSTMKEDENSKNNVGITNQTNIQINNNIQDKLNSPEFASKFGELLLTMDPEDIESVVDAKFKADAQNEYYNKK